MKIAIIGAGAAGMMAAARVLEIRPETELFLIERNTRLGAKVLISGGGRCNVTTGFSDMREILKKYPRGSNFLKHALYSFPPKDVYEWFENHGVPLKVEDDLRVFPVSNNGHDVVGVFQKLFNDKIAKKEMKILFGTKVVHTKKMEEGFSLELGNGEILNVDKLILTTGGQAYRHTGSSGDGYSFAEELAHSITPLAASLHSFITAEPWSKELAGLSFGKAYMLLKGEKQYAFSGPFVFTHRGISGPVVFALSSLSAFEKLTKETPLRLFIDFLPGETNESLLASIEQIRTAHPKKLFRNTLDMLLPKSLAEVLAKELEVGEKMNAETSQKTVHKTRDWIKAAPLTLIGKGEGDEFVTAGGVDLAEVDAKTMESKIAPGLFFAGEILDIDGFTGGFNLQAAWATGRLAGESSAH